MKVIEALKAGTAEGFNNYLEDEYRSWTLDEWVRISMAKAALHVAVRSFDEKYFKKQMACFDFDEECTALFLISI